MAFYNNFCEILGLSVLFIKKQPSFSYKFIIFARKLKRMNMEERKLYKIKVVLAEKDKTGRWLSKQIGKSNCTVSK